MSEHDDFLQCPHEVIRATCGAGGCNCPCDPCAPSRPAPEATDPTPGEVRLNEAEQDALAEAYYTAHTRHSRTAVSTWGQLAPHQREYQRKRTLEAAVERILTDHLATTKAERDSAQQMYAELHEEWGREVRHCEAAAARAEAAEAEVADLRARLEGLASDWATRENRTGAPYATAFVNGFHAAAADLRAALGGEHA